MAKHSPALTSFRARLQEVNRLLKLCEPINSPLKKRARSRKKDDTLCRASLILLCSHMEGYFEDLVENVIRFHEFDNTLVANLPTQLRVTQIWGQIGSLDVLNDTKKWNIIQIIRTQNAANDALNCSSNFLDSDLHTKGFATPGSKEVEKLFRSVGVEDIWDQIELKHPKSKHLKRELDVMVARRHPIAHGDVNATATPGDVEQYVRGMKRLASLFELVVASHLSNSFGRANPWDLFP